MVNKEDKQKTVWQLEKKMIRACMKKNIPASK
jgi:hypothetical protein